MSDFSKKISEYLIARSYPTYNENCGRCAKAVREAVEFVLDPKKIERTESAKNYGPSYEKIGFKKVFSFPEQDKQQYKPEIGDLAIIKYEPHGHICIYCFGKDLKTNKNFCGWVSDFRQRDMYGGIIRKKNPSFDIYRYGI